MASKLLIIMVNTDPMNCPELGAPIMQATVAATMEYDVEVIFSGISGRLALRGVAENLRIHEGANKTVYDLIREAQAAGVVFKVSSTTIDIWGGDLIPEISEPVGSAYIISEAMDNDTVALSY
ncbi:50S ribosomal protein L33 [Nitrococcus mobilis]|uniref:50S ribosomal protein L33 n=1 Tax=Nitrococcus mobilis TaxID=35797 RepID=UPI0002E37A9A|nr:50S ribosomal protein L33 [Nitrococcus mobilis]